MKATSIATRLAVAIVAGAAMTAVSAQSSLEYNVKAALLLNFARFIEWPDRAFATPTAPVEICVFTPDPFGEALDRALQGEKIGTRPLVARDVRSPSETNGCHLLFIPAGTESRATAMMRQAGPHTVTVGESPRFETMGGAVTFVLEGGRVRFNVNLRPVEERGVRISARMLHLASRVDRPTQEK